MGTGLEANAAARLLETGAFVEGRLVESAAPFGALVGRGRLELPTNGLKVRCSTD